MRKDFLIIVRGGGDLATGTICKLRKSGFSVWVLECGKPMAIRRKAAFSEAVYEGKMTVEGLTAVLVRNRQEAEKESNKGNIPVLIDENADILKEIRPLVLVDAILAKKNLGTNREMAPVTIALGPGFEAGKDVDLVIETKRGHQLGRLIYEGTALPNTGIPGVIGGYGKERVIHAPIKGTLSIRKEIGDLVKKEEVLAVISGEAEKVEIHSPFDGVLRGMIRDGFEVFKGMKIADVDPRVEERENCFTISDKARCIAGGVLEGVLTLVQREEEKEVE